jgi:hypothetical protein
MSISRRNEMRIINKLIALVFTSIALAGFANAQSLHMVVDRGNYHYYEINPNINIGGQYTISPHYVGPLFVYGYTDRVSRGQFFGMVILGKGSLDDVGIEVSERTVAILHNVPLIFAYGDFIPLDPSWRNMEVFYHSNGRLTEVRVPIGTR